MNHCMSLLGSWYYFEMPLDYHFFWSSNKSCASSVFVNYFVLGSKVRFLLRSGREYDQAPTDSDKLSPRFLGYFLFRSSERKQSSDKRFI